MKLSFAILATLALSKSVSKDDNDKKNRGDKYQEKALNSEWKEPGEFGDDDYDGKALFGEDDFETIEDLSPEEQKEKLSKLIDKMDRDGDGIVTEEELTVWIHYVQTKYIYDDTERQWEENDKNNDGKVTWEEYKTHTYGFLNEDDFTKEEDDGFSYAQMQTRDERRWKKADKENKGYLTKEDLTAFLHPEEYDHMKEMVVIETIEDIDKDGDGRISLDEYIGDMWVEGEDGDEPEWIEEERSQFHENRDKDNSGYLEHQEIRDWILPAEYDHAEGEAKHLIETCDNNNDKSLSKDEILENYETFVGSQATDWGDAIVRHDEF